MSHHRWVIVLTVLNAMVSLFLSNCHTSSYSAVKGKSVLQRRLQQIEFFIYLRKSAGAVEGKSIDYYCIDTILGYNCIYTIVANSSTMAKVFYSKDFRKLIFFNLRKLLNSKCFLSTLLPPFILVSAYQQAYDLFQLIMLQPSALICS